MKKIFASIFISSLLLCLLATSAFACGHRRQTAGCTVCPHSCTGYVDVDGDGVCDNCGANSRCAGYFDADGDGVCDNCDAQTLRTGTGCHRRCGGWRRG